MHFFPIQKLRIFDVVPVEGCGRKLGALLGMDIDRVRVYSLPSPRIREVPASGFQFMPYKLYLPSLTKS